MIYRSAEAFLYSSIPICMYMDFENTHALCNLIISTTHLSPTKLAKI